MKKSYGQVAYEAYRGGKPTVPWSEKSQEVRVAWQVAAGEVIAAYLSAGTEDPKPDDQAERAITALESIADRLERVLERVL